MMPHSAIDLDADRREIVLRALIDVCRHRNWVLHAAHVRTAHVHAVIGAEVAPEPIMNALKSYASRALRRRHCWARHGSTRYLWTPDEVTKAIRYVLAKQGEPMAVFEATASSKPSPDC